MKLQLTKPIAFFDIESTHKDPLKARIIELGIILIYPDGESNNIRLLFNPGENITDENAAIHGFTNEMVKDWPAFKEKAAEVSEIFKGVDIGTFNGNSYDIPLLNEELTRAGINHDFSDSEFVDAGNLFKILAPRTLTAAVLTYLKKDHAGAHGAIADTQATIDVLLAMLDKHSDELAPTVAELALKSNYGLKRLDLAGKFKYRADGVEIFTFGKHKDEPLSANIEYLKWMLGAKMPDGKTYSFSLDTRNIIERYIYGYNTKETDKKPVLPSYHNPGEYMRGR